MCGSLVPRMTLGRNMDFTGCNTEGGLQIIDGTVLERGLGKILVQPLSWNSIHQVIVRQNQMASSLELTIHTWTLPSCFHDATHHQDLSRSQTDEAAQSWLLAFKSGSSITLFLYQGVCPVYFIIVTDNKVINVTATIKLHMHTVHYASQRKIKLSCCSPWDISNNSFEQLRNRYKTLLQFNLS